MFLFLFRNRQVSLPKQLRFTRGLRLITEGRFAVRYDDPENSSAVIFPVR
ncbi:hypothetical protein BIFANG_03632 [Bifidobacterium angulatum DSM 20098 = JCM 7096]|uniref:Uncharacterized protein n=1 Tax=Bifidobacterium angulatum DSM 20098 = JCM 7096 TaxID=518635 RepID=C4FH01_9BIFI|nr:hypothetical protein BIFANG_03632 [Bifidobacterium angulatum DSM 20098 = JCM 7096]